MSICSVEFLWFDQSDSLPDRCSTLPSESRRSGASAMVLDRQLAVSGLWSNRSRPKRLDGAVEVDELYLGTAASGKVGWASRRPVSVTVKVAGLVGPGRCSMRAALDVTAGSCLELCRLRIGVPDEEALRRLLRSPRSRTWRWDAGCRAAHRGA